MKQTFLLAFGCMMMASGAWATNYTLTLYADGCDSPNIVTHLDVQQSSVNVSVNATPIAGYHFLKWNDGNTDNPRLVTVDQNLTYTAFFAMDYEGKCGDNLYWQYADNTLTITGTGAMYDYTSSTMPWLLFCDSITKIIIPDGITSIGNYAFAACIGLKSVIIPNSVTKIGAGAFSGCRRLYDVYCYAPEPPIAETSSFENYNVYLHVPCNCLRYYQMDVLFVSFKYIVCDEIGTDIEELHKSQEDTSNGKFIQNGYLYILRDGTVYNAVGGKVDVL